MNDARSDDHQAGAEPVETAKTDRAEADRSYTALLPFAEWQQCEVPGSRWDAHLAALTKRRRTATAPQLRRAAELVKQVAAIETGAIEGLYEEGRGFTLTAATEVAAFAAALESRPQRARAYIEAQLRAYDFVLDMATEARPIAETWIRELHTVICGEGATYSVETAIGPQDQVLPLGMYKPQPNHVKLPSGELHSYAPVEETSAEMARLVLELRSGEFQTAHPVLQSAYAHYGIVWIHPFADGNGRVARALASVYSYRAASIPILITAQQKPEYLASLRAADAGDRQGFVRFMFEKTLDTMRLIQDSLITAAAPELHELLSQLQGVYVTRGGYDHLSVDEAAYRIFDRFQVIMTNLVESIKNARLQGVSWADGNAGPAPDGFRLPVAQGSRRGLVSLVSVAPADVKVERAHIVYVPASAGPDDVIRLATGDDQLEIPVADVVRTPSLPIQIEARLTMFAQRLLADQLRELRSQSERRIADQGY